MSKSEGHSREQQPSDPSTGFEPERDNPILPFIIGAALFMQTLDANVVANALPAIGESYGTSSVAASVVITAYLVAGAVFLPLSAWIADRVGANTTFMWAVAGFAIASWCCTLAQSLPQLVVARAFQGAAGAMLMPVGRLVILRNVPRSNLIAAMSYLTIPAVFGPILGPPIGGFFVTYATWRWIFYVNVPIGIVGLFLAARFIPSTRETTVERLDLIGFLLAALALGGAVYGIEALSRGPPTAMAVVSTIAGVASGIIYVNYARGRPNAILDLSLLRVNTFRVSVLGGFFFRQIMSSTPFLLALLFQVCFGLNAFEAGLLTFAGAVGALFMKGTARFVIRRLGFRTTLIANAVVVASLMACYAFFREDTPYWAIVGTLFVAGFLRSLQMTALAALSFAEIGPEKMSRASSLAGVFQQLSQGLGISVAAVIAHSLIDSHAGSAPVQSDIAVCFLAIAVISLFGLPFFVSLSRGAGADMLERK